MSGQLPPHIAADYATGFANGNGHGLNGFVASASATEQDAFAKVTSLNQRISSETEDHREDGYEYDAASGSSTYFGARWRQEEYKRHELLSNDEQHKFATLVAGLSGRPLDRLLDKDALDEHAKRMLQRAAFADELSKTALKDLDQTRAVLKDFEKTTLEFVDYTTQLKQATSDAEFVKTRFQNAKTTLFPIINNNLYPKENDDWGFTFDIRLSFEARCLYPTEGLESVQFADRFLSALATMSEDADMLRVNETSATVKQDIKARAAEQNPKLINLSAYITFLVHAVSSTSACNYIVKRMHADECFPAEGAYAADKSGAQFCADLLKLAKLFESDTKNCVTMKTMSARLFIHLRCMQERWFGVQKQVVDGDENCDARPQLQKPELSRKEKSSARLFLAIEDGNTEETLYHEETPNEGSTLDEEQRKTRKSRGESSFQDQIGLMLAPFFRRGVVTIVYDMARLRNMLCRSTREISSSLLCENDDEKMVQLRRVQPVYDSNNGLVTLSYFYGGIDISTTGVWPMHVWTTEFNPQGGNRSAAYYFLQATLMLYERALDASEPFADDTEKEWFLGEELYENAETEEKMYEKRTERFFKIVKCSDAARTEHVKQRKSAGFMLLSVTDVFVDLLRTYENISSVHARFSGPFGGVLFGSIAEDEPLPVYLPRNEVKALLENKGNSLGIALVHVNNLLKEDDKVNKIFEDLNRVIRQLNSAEINLRSKIREFNAKIVGTNDNLLSSVSKRFDVSITSNTSHDLVHKLKQLLAQTYAPSGAWAMRPENTGIIIFNSIFVAAVSLAYADVQRYVPNLATLTVDDLKYDPITTERFADLCASHIAQVSVNNPTVPTLNRMPEDLRLRRADIFKRLRELCAPVWRGRGSDTGIERNPNAGTVGADFLPGAMRASGFGSTARISGPVQWAINLPPYSQPSHGGALASLPTLSYQRSACPRNDYVERASAKRPIERAAPSMPSPRKSTQNPSTSTRKIDEVKKQIEEEKERLNQDFNKEMKEMQKKENELTKKMEKLNNEKMQVEKKRDDLQRKVQSQTKKALQPSRKKQKLDKNKQKLDEKRAITRKIESIRKAHDEYEKTVESLTNTDIADNSTFETLKEKTRELQGIVENLTLKSDSAFEDTETQLHWRLALAEAEGLARCLQKRHEWRYNQN